MKAARYYGRGDVRIEDVPIPEIRDGQCLIEVEWCGICGSDLHEYLAGMCKQGIPIMIMAKMQSRPDRDTYGGKSPSSERQPHSCNAGS